MIQFGSNPLIMKKIHLFGKDILFSEKYKNEHFYMQHGSTSTYTHSLAVTYVSIILAEKLGISIDMRSLIRGALLHDYFLYDWHIRDRHHWFHGYTHAARALENAKRDFIINHIENEIIRTHMFPLNLTKFPTCREAFIVSLADKICAGCETIRIASYTENMIKGIPSNKDII